MFCDVYGDSSTSRTKVFEWHKRFVKGSEDVEDDDPESRRPCTSMTDGNIEKVRQLVLSNHRLTIANEVGMEKETVRTIFVDNLGIGSCVPK